MSGMLQGVRVIELGTVITAPLAGMMLGDFGADVIKVERPEGDPFRLSQGCLRPTFLAYNRNKRSIVLDLTTEAGLATLLDLIDGAEGYPALFRLHRRSEHAEGRTRGGARQLRRQLLGR